MTSPIKISQLPDATPPLTGAELVPLVQSAVTKKATVTQIGDAVFTNAGFATAVGAAQITATGTTTARSLVNRAADVLNVKDFGAVGDGVADDTAEIQAAIDAAQLAKKNISLPSGNYKITAPLVINFIGLVVTGNGPESSILFASGNFSSIIEMNSSAAEIEIQGVSIRQTGTTTRCVSLNRALTITFYNCGFTGNFTGSLVYSQGDIITFSRCKWDCNAANTLGVEFDSYNQNCSIENNCRFGGIGLGTAITQSNVLNPRVEGLKIADSTFINTGVTNVSIGNSLLTIITGCVLDQAGSFSISIQNGADCVLIDGNWLGLQPVSAGINIYIAATAGGNHIISNNEMLGGSACVNIQATASLRVSRVIIEGNVFLRSSDYSLNLDSVLYCTIINNQDGGTPTNGSWITTGSHASGGQYVFDNNQWYTVSPALFHTGSIYRGGNDTGIVWRNTGTVSVSAAATTTVNHGCFRTPSYVGFSIEGSNLGAQWLTGVGATQFTANWATSGSPVIRWQAEVQVN